MLYCGIVNFDRDLEKPTVKVNIIVMRADATIQIRLQTVKVITKHFLGHEAQHVPRLLK